MMMSNSCIGSSVSSSLPLTRVISGLSDEFAEVLKGKKRTIFEAVGLYDLLGLINDVGHIDLNSNI